MKTTKNNMKSFVKTKNQKIMFNQLQKLSLGQIQSKFKPKTDLS